MIAEFAHKAQKKISGLQNEDDIRWFTNELETQIHGINSQTSNDSSKNAELDNLGTDIWNTCVRLGYDEDLRKAPIAKALIYARVFAFQIMVLSYGTSRNEYSDLVRMSKLALKTSKSCLGRQNVQLEVTAP